MRMRTVLLLLAAACRTAHAQCDTSAGRPIEIAGQVIDSRAFAPLRAKVLLTAGTDTLATLDADSAGYFFTTLCRRAGIVAHFRRIGYRADSLALVLDTMHWAPLDVAMTPLQESPAVTLAASRVTAARTPVAMESRARRAGGVYIGPDEIARVNPARVSDLFRGKRGVALEDLGGELRLVSTRGVRPNITDGGARLPLRAPAPATTLGARRDSTAGNSDEPTHKATGGGESCALRIGVNGHLMPEEYRVDELPVGDIVAIEIYSSVAAMPVEFASTRRTMNCGLAMIWTRDGTDAP
jgi:hypothetical protein